MKTGISLRIRRLPQTTFEFLAIQTAQCEDSDQTEADLNLCWAHITKGTFYDIAVLYFKFICAFNQRVAVIKSFLWW